MLAQLGTPVPKLDALSYVETLGEVTSADPAAAFGWTRAGAASTLLRYHRHGHLRRRCEWRRRRSDGRRWEFAGFVYHLSQKGSRYIAWARRGW